MALRTDVSRSDKDHGTDRDQRIARRYGPFMLSLPMSLSPEALDEDLGGTSWLQVGLIVDPTEFRNDADQIARHIDIYIAWLMSRTGDHITIYGRDYALQIAEERSAVTLPLWLELA